MKGEWPRAIAIGERSKIAWGGLKWVERPVACSLDAAAYVEDRGRLRREQAYAEGVKGSGQALACGLDVGLLARPAEKESALPLGVGEGDKLCCFFGAKEAIGDLLHVFDGPQLFEIDTEIAAEGYGEDGEMAGVGRVETQAGVGG
jgi:hypothetical protein